MENISKRKADANILTFDDLILTLKKARTSEKNSSFLWRNVSNEIQRELLYKIAEELNLLSPRFIASKELEKHKYNFIGGISLNGLYSFYKKGIKRAEGVHIISNICDLLNIPEASEEEYINNIKENNIFSWKNISTSAKREILLRASEEIGYPHPIFINNDDFSRKFKFLNGKTLAGFYTSFRNENDDIRGSIIKNICDELNIEITENDWIEYITSDKVTTFWNIIPKEIINKILFKGAVELGYSNPRMMSIDDFKVELKFLKGMSLYSFVSRYFHFDKDGISNVDYICNIYSVSKLTNKEWIEHISYHKNVRWEFIPKSVVKSLLIKKAESLGKENPRMLKYEDMCGSFPIINGKNLQSLYSCYMNDGQSKKIDTVNYLCNKVGIPPLSEAQWLTIIADPKSKTLWETVPKEVQKKILISAAEEVGVNNPRLIGYSDFCTRRFKFLNGKTLSGLYSYYGSKVKGVKVNLIKYICDSLKFEGLTMKNWIESIASETICRWDSVPLKVQREVVVRAASEMGLSNPRMMGTKEFDSVRLKIIGGKTLSGLYYYYGDKLQDNNRQINEYIFDTLNIPKIDINPKTGRINTNESSRHNKYFDSMANIKEFINCYLNNFDLQSLCRKYSVISNSRKAGIYIRGLVTILAPLSRSEYIDFLYDVLKNVPADELGLKKSAKYGYRLQKSMLYSLAGIKDSKEEKNSVIKFADPDVIDEKDRKSVLKKLAPYRKILDIKEKKYKDVYSVFVKESGNNYLFNIGVAFSIGDIITDNEDREYEVVECSDIESNGQYTMQIRALSSISKEAVRSIKSFSRTSNDNILISYLDSLMLDVAQNSVSPLLAVALELKKEAKIFEEDLRVFAEEDFYNKNLNETQKQAVALSCSLDGENNVLEIVQGPPGTGKTTLIKEIALQYYNMNKNVLILAKTNVAVDNVLQKLIGENINVLRTGNNIKAKSYLEEAQVFSTSNNDYLKRIQGKAKIVLGTPMGFFLDKNKEEEHYDIIIIDEASQMDVPETLFSLGFGRNCVIIGDHEQIPPFPIEEDILLQYNPRIDLSTSEELQKSLFETLIMNKCRYSSIFLDINYRTKNPEVVSLVSEISYDGRLRPDLSSEYYDISSSKRKKLYGKNSIEVVDTSEIVDVDARAETEIDSTYYNTCEAMYSVRKVIELLKSGETFNDICIITPYRAQVEILKKEFRGRAQYFNHLSNGFDKFVDENIYTIDSFQGREQENVIINCVRSNFSRNNIQTKTGFLKDYRRINVALSRARKKLVVIGDFSTLLRSENMKVRYIFSKLKNFNKEKRIIL